MSIADNPGPDDPMFDHFKQQLADIQLPQEAHIVTNMSLLQLAEELAKVKDQLREAGELYKVRTQSGRELHSRRSALQIELNKRSSQ